MSEEKRVCRCGFQVHEPHIHPKPVYGIGGWMLLLLGATPKPQRIEYRCGRCDHLFGYTTDPELLRRVD